MKLNFKDYFKNLDAILISSNANIIYLTGDIGFSQTERECLLLITKNKKFLITDGRYSQVVIKRTENFEVIDSGVYHFLNEGAQEIFENNKIKTLGFEDNNLTVEEHLKINKLSKTKPVDLRNLRIIKKNDEIKNIKLACKIGDQTFDFIVTKLKFGISEKEIANELEFFIKKKGADISFKPIVAFGKNSSVPHHLSGKSKLRNNEIVLLDFGVRVNNYCSDMSRTVFFGSATAKFKRMHKTVLEAQQKAIKSIKSGVKASEVDKVARDYIASNNYLNIPHSVGHGIGIEVHESPHLSPNSKDKIEKGMVFSIEPGIYIENYGGVRIEDLVLANKNNVELITHAKRNLIEL